MNVLVEWLGPTVEQELGNVLEWLSTSDTNDSQVTGRLGGLTFIDDGSNLRIKSARPRVLQIVKFTTDGDPIQYTLSDSVHRVNATFSRKAVSWYSEHHGRKLTNTVGGMIQLLDFEIVATNIGSRAKRITLLIESFKPLGATGSAQFGVPQAIEDRVKIQDLIQKLQDFRDRELGRNRDSSKPSSSKRTPLKPSGSVDKPEDNQIHESQAFATQVPAWQTSTVGNVRPADSGNGKHSFQQLSAEASGPPTVPSLGTHEFRTNFGNHARSTIVSHPKVDPGLPPVKGKPIHAPSNEELLGILGGTQKRVREMPASDHNEKVSEETLTSTIPSGQSIPQLIYQANSVPKNQSDSPEPSNEHIQPQSRGRIPARDVRISKDQEMLLSSADSWLPAEPGHRGPVANIPIATLQSLSKKANVQSRERSTPPRKRTHSSAFSEPKKAGSQSISANDDDLSADEGSAETKSETPISASEWPPSPRRSELPPDSSNGSVDLEVSHNLQKRRSSSVSKSSQMALLGRQGSKASNKSFEQSQSSAIAVCVSIPSLGGRKGLNCETDGSCKPYESSESLRYHMENHRDVNLSQRSFDCCSEGCDNVYTSRGSLNNHIRHCHDQKAQKLDSPSGTPKSQVSHASTPFSTKSSSAKSKKQKVVQIDLSSDCETRENLITTNKANPRRDAQEHDLNTQRVSALVVNENLNASGNHHDSPAVHSISSSPNSDLETAIPLPLNKTSTIAQGPSPITFPCTAVQSTDPFTQVKRTPCIHDRKHGYSLPKRKRRLSPSMYDVPSSPANGSTLDDVDHVTMSAPSVNYSASSTNQSAPSMEALILERPESQLLGVSTNVHPVDSDSLAAITDSSERMGLPSPIGPVEQDHELSDSDAPEKKTTELMGLGYPPIASARKESRESTTSIGVDVNERAANERRDSKRQASEISLLFPNVSKRRKKYKVPITFDRTEELNARSDPVEGAKRWRQEFLASRRNYNAARSEASSRVSAKGTVDVSGFIESQEEREGLNTTGGPLSQSEDMIPPVLQTSAGKTICAFDAQDPHGQPKKSAMKSPNLTGHDSALQSEGGTYSAQVDLQDIDPELLGPELEPQRVKAINLDTDNSEDDMRPQTVMTTNEHNPSMIAMDDYSSAHASLANRQDMHADDPTEPKCQVCGGIQDTGDLGDCYRSPGSNGNITRSATPTTPKNDSLREAAPSPLETLNKSAQPIDSSPISALAPQSQACRLVEEVLSSHGSIADTDLSMPVALSSATLMQHGSHPVYHNIFDRFKAAYPVYTGDFKHMVAICRKISKVWRSSLHQSLWDDFIIRHRIEYAEHLKQCAEVAEDALPYDDFYRSKIEQPLYMKRVITLRNIEEASSILELAPSDPTSKVVNRGGIQAELVKGTHATEPKTTVGPNDNSSSIQRQYSAPVTISLLSDDEQESRRKDPDYDPSVQDTKQIRKLRSRKESAVNFGADALRTPRNSTESHTTSPLHGCRSSGKVGKAGGKVKIRSRKTQDQSSPRTLTASDIRAALKRIAKTAPEPRTQRSLDSRSADISSPRTLTASDLRVVLKATAKKEPEPRSQRSLNSKSTGPDLQRSIQLAGSRTVEDEPDAWWRDDNTPYKSFAEAYDSIRSGHGNSFANTETAKAQPDRSHEKKTAPKKEKKIDPMNWHL